ncbi:MAG: phage head-tail joining protein [Aeromonas sp.]
MAFTLEDLTNINEALASGELTVMVNGRQVTYRTIKELLEAKRHIQGELDAAAGKRKSPFAGFRVCVDRGIR